jgi:fatty acid desaturase
MLVFVAVALSLLHKAFPKNWLLVAFIYVGFVPIAFLYGWLISARPIAGTNISRPRVPPLLLIGVAAAVAIFGYAMFRSEIDAAFYPM